MLSSVVIASGLLLAANTADAMQCREVVWRKGMVVRIDSAISYGTRVQLPADLAIKPKPANPALWDVDGATNQVLIKPNSTQPMGQGTTVRLFTTDGNAFDLILRRTAVAQSDICVEISATGAGFSATELQALNNAASSRSPANAARVKELQTRLGQVEVEKDQAVGEALRKFRYHVYTRYDWKGSKGFHGKGLVTDVYDDGRFTYIRLGSPNRGLMSVETKVGGKTAIVNSRYDDTYAMYVVEGIYPTFTLRMDKEKVQITRADSNGRGAF